MSALADDIETAKQSREHDNTNVLSLPADEVNFELAKNYNCLARNPVFQRRKYKRRIER